MVEVTVLYPNEENKKIDTDYYWSSHIPMVKRLLGESCKKIGIETGIAGIIPSSKPFYLLIGHLYFESVESFNTAFAPHAQVIMNDISVFTTISPIIQISEVMM